MRRTRDKGNDTIEPEVTERSGTGRKSRVSDSTAELPLHLPGGQNFDRPRSSVFIGTIRVFFCTVEGVEVVRIE